MNRAFRTFAVTASVLLLVSGAKTGSAQRSDASMARILARRAAISAIEDGLRELEAKQVDKLAKDLARKKLASGQLVQLRALLVGVLSEQQVAVLEQVARPQWDSFEGLDRTVAKWRELAAKSVFTLTKRALKAKLRGSAERIARRAIELHPDLKPARRYLGEQRLGKKWVRSWRARMERNGHVLDSRAGWVRSSEASKLDQGLLPTPQGWKERDAATKLRERWSYRWKLDWGRWRIETNVAPDVLLDVALTLDRTERVATRLLGDRYPVDLPPTVSVLVFRTKRDYDAEIDREHGGAPHMKQSPGYFSDQDLSIHLWWDPKLPLENHSLLVHEATHALISGAKAPRTAEMINGPGDGFEEVPAMAMEAFSRAQFHDSTDSSAQPFAATRVPRPGRRLTLRQFLESSLSGGDFVDSDQAYNHSVALAMYCGAGRDGVIVPWQIQEYLWHLRYHGPNPDLFAKMMGKSWPELEKDWTAFLDKLAKEGVPWLKKKDKGGAGGAGK